MTKSAHQTGSETNASQLTRGRAEKIAAIEGLHLTDRVEDLLRQSAHLSGDARRALVRAMFAQKKG